MRYRSVNCLQDFEFHDSFWSLAGHDASSYIFDARALNLHQTAPQNPEDCDMEIESSRVTFSGCQIAGFRAFKEETPKNFTGEKSLIRFLREANHGMWVKGFNEIDHDQWLLASCGDKEIYYEVTLRFEDVVVEWDAFRRPAWYVLHAKGIEA